MVPHTYHADHEKKVRVCDACHYIMENFRSALLEGDVDKAISFFSTGNVNLVSPYKIFEHNWFPLHAAAKGGNLTLFKFLVEQHKVPIYYYKQGVSLPYCTNDGKSVLAIAAQEKKWDIVRYLVVEKHVPMTQVTDCSVLQVRREDSWRAIPHTFVNKGGGGANKSGLERTVGELWALDAQPALPHTRSSVRVASLSSLHLHSQFQELGLPLGNVTPSFYPHTLSLACRCWGTTC